MCRINNQFPGTHLSTASTWATSCFDMYYVLRTMYYVLCIMYCVLCTMYDALSIRYEVTLASTMQADAVAVKDSSACARLHSAACQWVVGCLSSLSAM